jgi:tRNA 2-selenouridine synthase SelU
MEYVNIGTGLFLIIIGFAIVKYPTLIAGYNTMSEERKKKVDVDGLSSWIFHNCKSYYY